MSRSRKTKKKAIRTRPSTNQLRRTFFGKKFPVLHPCGYCGIVSRYEMDHIIAFAKHGSNSKANLTPSCERCNRTKSKKTLLQWFRGLTTRKLNKIIQHNKGNKSSFAKKIKETHMKQNNMTRKAPYLKKPQFDEIRPRLCEQQRQGGRLLQSKVLGLARQTSVSVLRQLRKQHGLERQTSVSVLRQLRTQRLFASENHVVRLLHSSLNN